MSAWNKNICERTQQTKLQGTTSEPFFFEMWLIFFELFSSLQISNFLCFISNIRLLTVKILYFGIKMAKLLIKLLKT